jgi:ankyrin repeat protein
MKKMNYYLKEELFIFMRNEQTEKAIRLLKKYPELLHEKIENGATPFLLAVQYNNPTLIHWIVSKDIDVNVRDDSGRTAMMWAFFNGDLNLLTLLMEKGMDLNSYDKNDLLQESDLKVTIDRFINQEHKRELFQFIYDHFHLLNKENKKSYYGTRLRRLFR